MTQRYVIALGSNQRHARLGSARAIIRWALAILDEAPLTLCAASSSITTCPIGPSQRAFINAVAVIETKLLPDALIAHLHLLEAHAGRRRAGQRWRARTLDLDIILWSGGVWADESLFIPHPAFRERAFVLRPMDEVAADWREPITGLRVKHLKVRLDRVRRAA